MLEIPVNAVSCLNVVGKQELFRIFLWLVGDDGRVRARFWFSLIRVIDLCWMVSAASVVGTQVKREGMPEDNQVSSGCALRQPTVLEAEYLEVL